MRPPASPDPRTPYGVLAACLVAILWAIGSIDVNGPPWHRVAMLVAGVAIAVASLCGVRRGLGLALAVLALAIGASERLERELLEHGSDVLPATAEALNMLLRGANPYAHPLQSTIPPGSPLVYGPGELLFYLPARFLAADLGRVESWAGIATILALALLGLRAGAERAALPAMLYATWGIAAFRTTDGGNDVGAALVVVLALVTLALAGPGRFGTVAFFASAVFFGWALAFKQFAVLVVPVVLRHLAVSGAPWRRFAAVTAAAVIVLDLPFLLWDPAAFLNQHVVLALTNHTQIWGTNLLHALVIIDPSLERLAGAFFVAELALTLAALALAVRWRVPSIGAAAIAGAGLVALPLFLARWSTQSYYVYAATVALAGLALLEVRGTPEREVH